MINIIAACVWLAWTPAENALEYDVYEDMIFAVTVTPPEVEVCRITYNDPILFHVVGIKGEKESAPSGTLEVQWIHWPDWDDNGAIGFPDFGLFVGAFGSSRTEFDLDEDGIVGFSDFGLFARNYGMCTGEGGGIVAVPCGG